MYKPGALVIYKNHPALVTESRDRISITLEDGTVVKVRDKDISLLHGGPVKGFPEATRGGDFETARRMLAGEGGSSAPASWSEVSELVFGQADPADVLACFIEASDGLLFRLVDGLPYAAGDEEVIAEAGRRAKKAGETAERSSFVERARAVRKNRKSGAATESSDLISGFPAEGDERFMGELESLALGKTSKSKIASEIGIQETAESAHEFLVACGYWDSAVNPHPVRSGCPLRAQTIALGEDRTAPGARRDLTGFISWAIDNAWSRDPDDAIGWDGESIWIHVADPASAILPDSPADREALARGATLYLPEMTSPMLPDEALERYGLGLAPTSPALSFRVALDAEGFVSDVEVITSTVRVRRCSYGEADSLLAAGEPDLSRLDAVARLRQKRRVDNGAVEIELPEVRVHVESGEVSIDRTDSYRSSAIVRELMLLAGEAAARWAFARNLAFPFYSQEAPSIPAEKGQSESSLSLHHARRRGMRAGILGPSPSAHRGLGLPFYAQATSPLRRYQDLLGHMQIHAVLEGRPPLDADEVGSRCALAQAAQAPNRQAERASELHWTLVYLSRNPEWEGEGVIVSASGPGNWLVLIPTLGMETRMKIPGSPELDGTVRIRASRIDIPLLESTFEALK